MDDPKLEIHLEAHLVSWPSMVDVQLAGRRQLVEWHRFLPAAKTDEQLLVIAAIINRIWPTRYSEN